MKNGFVYVIVFGCLIIHLAFGSFNVNAEETLGETQGKILETLEFRKMFGLETSMSKIQEAEKISEEFGVYLTIAEENELKERFAQQDKDVEAINKYLMANFSEDELGGLYVDQEKGGVIIIGFANQLRISDSKITKAKTVLSDISKGPVEFKYHKYSEKELNKVYDLINKDMISLEEKQGISVYLATANITNNTVDLYINDLTPTNLKLLTTTYGDSLNIKRGEEPIEESRTAKHRPLHGGLAIGAYITRNNCTSGYGATDLKGGYYLITAGHCSGTNWYQGRATIGTRTKSQNQGSIDAMAIRLSPSIYASKYVYTNAAFGSALTSSQNQSNEYIGQAVCKAGMKTGVTCGKLFSTNLSGWSGRHYGLKGATYSSVDGDSGGTVYYGNQLRGVHKGTTNGIKAYTHVNNITRAFSLFPIH